MVLVELPALPHGIAAMLEATLVSASVVSTNASAKIGSVRSVVPAAAAWIRMMVSFGLGPTLVETVVVVEVAPAAIRPPA